MARLAMGMLGDRAEACLLPGHEMRQTGQSRSQCSSSSPSRRGVQAVLTTWSESSSHRSARASGADSRHFLLAAPKRQETSPSPVGDRHVDALLDQSVKRAFQPLPPRGRHLSRLFERIDAGRRPAMALAFSPLVVDPLIDARQALHADADALQPRSKADFP